MVSRCFRSVALGLFLMFLAVAAGAQSVTVCIWEDANYNGLRDGGEALGIPTSGNLRVFLRTDSQLHLGERAIFDAGGCFSFTTIQSTSGTITIPAGNYQAGVELGHRGNAGSSHTPHNLFERVSGVDPPGMRWVGPKDVTSTGNPLASALDNDFGISGNGQILGGISGGDPTTVYSDQFAFDGVSDVTLHIGYVVSPTLGDRVFYDRDGDGIQGANEPGVPGVRVDIYRPSDLVNPYYSTMTWSDGRYRIGEFKTERPAALLDANSARFDGDMVPGNWIAEFSMPPGFAASPKDQTTDGYDSDINPNGRTDPFFLNSNSSYDNDWSDPYVDAGLLRSCTTTGDQIGGSVYQDFNGNGRLDPLETRLTGTVVTAYGDDNAVVDSATVTNGSYSLNVPDGTRVRLEFTSLAGSSSPGPAGYNSETTVQFVTAPSCAADLAINRPYDYCNPDPRALTACHALNSDPTSSNASPALISVPWFVTDEEPSYFQNPLHDYPADIGQLGSVFGLAYQQATRTIFAAAFLRGDSDLGPSGTGAIYSVDLRLASSNSARVLGDDEAPFADLNSLVSAGFSGTTTGTVNAPAAGALKEGLGDIDLSPDQQTLWAVNLESSNRALVEIAIGDPWTQPAAGDVTVHPLPLTLSTCTGDTGDIRPFGLGFNPDPADSLVYVGVVCTAESTQNSADLRGYVYTFDPAAPPLTAWNEVLQFPFDWVHPNGWINVITDWNAWGSASRNQPVVVDLEFYDGDLTLAIKDRAGDFNHDDSNEEYGDLLRACPDGLGGWALESNGACGARNTFGHDLGTGPGGGEFYFGDSTGDESGESQGGGIAARPGFGEVVALAMNAPFKSNTLVGFAWYGQETGDRTREYGAFFTGGFVKTSSGGDVEILCEPAPIEIGNRVWFDPDEDGRQDPQETPIGGVVIELLDGNGTVVATATTDSEGRYYFIGQNDPRAAEWTGDASIGVVSTYNGSAVTAIPYGADFTLRIVNSNFDPGNPLENRFETMVDYNAVAGDLHDSDGRTMTRFSSTFVGHSFTTGGVGQNNHTFDFGFGDAPIVNPLGSISVTKNTNPGGAAQTFSFTLSPDPGSVGAQAIGDGATATWNNLPGGTYTLSEAAVGGWTQGALTCVGVTELDGNPADASVQFNLTAGDSISCSITNVLTPPLSLGNRVWLDMGQGGGGFDNGLRDGTEPGVSGVLLQLVDENQLPVDLGSGPVTTLTDPNGYYLFDNLPEGRYRVRIAAANFQSGGVLQSFRSSTGAEANADADADLTDNGIDNSARDIEGIVSGVIELELTTEPAGEADVGPQGSGGAADNSSNLTVDFGLIDLQAPIMALGNRVWRDQSTDVNTNNGAHDTGEDGIAGVLVQLLGPQGQVLSQDVTDPQGFYLFENLPAGVYSVRVAASNFASGQPLAGLSNSTPTEIVPDGDGDLNDNGLPELDPASEGITSGPVTLVLVSEPTAEGDPSGNTRDENANLTVDFGFFEPLSLGNRVWSDPDDNGVQDPGEPGIGGVELQLFEGDGVTPVLDAVGQPRTQTTDPSGYYLFDDLPPGSYVLHVTPSNWQAGGRLVGSVSSTGAEGDPNADVDENDNGLDEADLATNGVFSNPVTLSYDVEPLGDDGSGGNARDANSNLTIDFGVVGFGGLYAIPTLGTWGMLLLLFLLMSTSVLRMR